ncbi:ABC transporter, ATP-binding protein [Indibacter alkaliphilus LW1]|uniref:ABC transporter, ATP-binding protein n=1 Tax=Indibacter alkaliphilus (strain CCUG 57479 / KCTC 22604 / LW1) TaxID=1189612 RepID=S2E555_INDAL|nr:ATP-binding cassette domain-containing protein [Indibacter alkaliphilus]EOZ99726.1 ABC transporter, ATP-binding protein [Indibacter alkaliphilus LW1]
MELLEIKNLSKVYGKNKALSHVDLNIPKGVIYGLLGPNGAGKTTLIRIINQIIEADSGTVEFKGERLNPKHISYIGYLPEERGLYKKMKVWDQLIYFARLKGLSGTKAVEKVRFWLDKLDISTWKDKRIDDLSKGMAQKVQFISTIIHEPELLILDEPFSGFDPMNAEIIKNEILELKEKGITIMLSTHRMESVELLCDHVAMINKSKKILDGKLVEIKQTFRPNQYKVKLISNGCRLPEELNFTENGNLLEFNLKLNGSTTNACLENLMQYGEVVGFSETLPSIEEIFIQQVKANTNG